MPVRVSRALAEKLISELSALDGHYLRDGSFVQVVRERSLKVGLDSVILELGVAPGSEGRMRKGNIENFRYHCRREALAQC